MANVATAILRDVATIESGEARLMFAVMDQAIRDLADPKYGNKREVLAWIYGSGMEVCCSHVGIDIHYAREIIDNLRKIIDGQ